MPSLSHDDDHFSAVAVIKRWWRDWATPKGDLATPSEPPAGATRVFGDDDELLIMRMEALQLEPGELKRIETRVFHELADTCRRCHSKDRCEGDLVHLSAGAVSLNWQAYCPNTATLNAVRDLPWFSRPRRGPDQVASGGASGNATKNTIAPARVD